VLLLLVLYGQEGGESTGLGAHGDAQHAVPLDFEGVLQSTGERHRVALRDHAVQLGAVHALRVVARDQLTSTLLPATGNERNGENDDDGKTTRVRGYKRKKEVTTRMR
jgi:hypothetical protein